MPMHTWLIACGLILAASQARRITWCRLRRASSSPTRDSLQVAPVAWPSSSAPLLTAQSVLVPPASIPRYSGMIGLQFIFPQFFVLLCTIFPRIMTRSDDSIPRMRLDIVDGIIIVAYLIGITLFGLRFHK